MKSAEEMTENVLERKRRNEKHRKTVARAAAVTLAVALCTVAAGFGLRNSFPAVSESSSTESTSTENNSAQTGGTNQNAAFEMYIPDGTDNEQNYIGYKDIISGDEGDDAYSYATPKNGECNLSVPLSRAIEKYGDSVRYRIRIDFFRDGKQLLNGSDEVDAEVERISAILMEKYGMGLSVLTFTDRDGKKTVTVTHDGAEKELIENFPVSNEYGYFLWLFTPGMVDDTGAEGTIYGGVDVITLNPGK